MNKNTIIRLNIFLFLAWAEFVIFTLSLILSSYLIKFFIMPFSKSLSINTYDGIRISLTFVIITIIQWYFKILISNLFKPSVLTAITLISSQAFSIFMINKILTKTIFIKYQISHLGIFICFIIPFYDFILTSFNKTQKINL